MHKWLSPIERAQLKAFPSERRQRDWLIGRLAAKILILRYLREQGDCSLPLNEIEIDYATGQEPQARANGQVLANLSLSIAHSHGHGLAGLSHLLEEGRIGVDLERIRPLHPRLAQRILTPIESETLRSRFSEEEQEALILYWTLKEAALKALPFALPMRQLEIQLLNNHGQARILIPHRGISLEARYWPIEKFCAAAVLAPPELPLS